MKRDNGSTLIAETYGKIIPHLQQLFNTDQKLISVIQI